MSRKSASQEDTPTIPVVPNAVGLLFNEVRDAVVIGDIETGRIVLWNRAAEAMFGYTQDEAIGQPIELIIPDRVRPQHRVGLARFRQTNHGPLIDARSPIEQTGVHKDGHELDVEMSLSSLNQHGLGHRFVMAILRDITDRNRLRRHLLLAQQFAHIGSWDWDVLHGSLVWSNEMYFLLGYAPGAFPPSAERFMAHVHPEDRPTLEQDTARVLAGQAPAFFSNYYRIVRADGEVRYVNGRAEVTAYRDGKPARLIGSTQDVTELRRALDGLQQTEARLAEAQALAHLGSWELDVATGRAEWSAELYRIFGESPETFTPTFQVYLKRTHPGDRKKLTAIKMDALEHQQPFTIDHRIRRSDGEYRHLRTLGKVRLDAQGKATRLFGTVQDITDQKRAEAEILHQKYELERANERLREVDRAKSEFLSVVSHELRTPLTAITNAASILRKQTAGPLNADQARFVGIIDEHTTRLGRLVNDILDLQKMEAEGLQLACTTGDLRPFVSRIGECFGHVMEEHHVAFSVELADEPLLAHFDADRLTQVVLNLLSNAAKFTPEGGHVRLEALACGPEVRVVVSDTGPGISPADLDRIFMMFVQAENTLSRRSGGTGLGLAISRRLVEAHGGRLEVESRVGEGSTFTIALPRAAAT